MLHPPLCPLRLGEHQPLLRRGQHPAEVEGGVQRRVQDVLCGAGDVSADAVEIIRKRHRPEHLPDRAAKQHNPHPADDGEVGRKVIVHPLHPPAIAGQVLLKGAAVHGGIVQLVGRGVGKVPAVAQQRHAHLQPLGRGFPFQLQQGGDQMFLLFLRGRALCDSDKIKVAPLAHAAKGRRAVQVDAG